MGLGHTTPKYDTWTYCLFQDESLAKQQIQKGFSDLSLKLVFRPSFERCPPSTWRNGVSLSLKMGGLQRNLKEQALLSFPQLTTDH